MAAEIASTVLDYVLTFLLAVAVISAICDRQSWKGPASWGVIGVVLVGTTAVCVGMAVSL